MKLKIGFIGLGLIGGSIAKAIRQYYPEYEIVAFDKNKETLALATQESIIDVAATTIDDNFHHCSYIFLCAPVSYNTAYLKQIKGYLHDGCILTDVGSVKTNIHREVEALGIEPYFIGGHPMAGSEKSGYSNAKAMLIENAYYVLTPTSKVPQEKIDNYVNFVRDLRAIPIILDYQEHDQVTGTISHLPHIIASSLVNFVRDTDTKDELMKNLAAGGFKDITRIASCSPEMWEQICMTNTENILVLLKRYITSLESICDTLENHNGDAIYKMFEESGKYRSTFPNRGQGPIERDYSFCVDVLDEPGSISVLSAILAAKGISVKNIGINHSREEGEGALRISFYKEDKKNEAAELLKSHNYVLTK
mgnify:CR=1 FL=1